MIIKQENKSEIDLEYLDMMLHNFTHALNNDIDNVYLGYIYLDDDNMKEFWIPKSEWVKTLDILIDGASKLEEYEFAIDFKNIKELLQ